ncbi:MULTISPECIES: NACHT domain-containing protein [unclassified Streptomyces]|uniref:NACHT domain-containing protein n=1 Tax=unclassified Streptomyces TaxID=2593676 RepID=UPI00131CA162|nr:MULTISPECIES: NACHT domain-containing protein [unclassified Streptomyces]
MVNSGEGRGVSRRGLVVGWVALVAVGATALFMNGLRPSASWGTVVALVALSGALASAPALLQALFVRGRPTPGLLRRRLPDQSAALLLAQVRAIESDALRRLDGVLSPRLTVVGPSARPDAPSGTAVYWSLAELHRDRRRRRTVLMGPPGSGKTTAAHRFVLDRAENHQDGEPVPVLADLSTWDPAATGVQEWFVSALAGRYRLEESDVRPLVTGGRVLPVLDGFDAIPEPQRETAATQLRGWLSRSTGHVVTSRGEAPEVMRQRTIGSAVELGPLPASAVASHLTAVGGDRWAPVARALEAHPDGPLAHALSSPWLLSLAVSGYADPSPRDPEELTGDRFPDEDAIRQRVLDTADPTATIEGHSGSNRRQRLELLTDAMGGEEDGLLLWWRMAKKYGSRKLWAALAVVLVGVPLLLSFVAEPRVGGRVAWTLLLLGAPASLFTPQVRGTPVRLVRPGMLHVAATVVVVLVCVWSAPVTDLPGARFPVLPSPSGLVLLLACLCAGYVVTAARADTEPSAHRTAGDLRVNGRTAFANACASTVLLCLPAALTTDHGGWQALPWHVRIALPAGVFAAFLLVGSAWGRYRLTHLRFVLSGDLPLALGRFLTTAETHGLLVRADGYGRGCHAFRNDRVRTALATGGAHRLPHVRAVQLAATEIREETVALPEAVAYLTYTADGDAETYEREAERFGYRVASVLDNELRAVADAGRSAYDRYRQARWRMAISLRGPLWALPTITRWYGTGVVATAAVALAAGAGESLLSDPNAIMGLVASVALFGVAQDNGRLSQGRLLPRWRPDNSSGAAGPLALSPWDRTFFLILFSFAVSGALSPLLVALFLPLVPDHARPYLAYTAGTLALFLALAWLYARPYVARTRAAHSEDPDDWPESSEPRYRDAARQARQDWLTAVARDGLMPLLRGSLRAGDDTAAVPVLPTVDPSRLTGSRRSDQFVGTSATAEIDYHLRELDSASIGISGPRGAGKSSLMQRFCTPGPTSAADDLLVLVPAPTSYDPREFLVHLFAEVCRAITGEAPGADGRPGPVPGRRTALLHRAGAALTTLAGLALVLGTLFRPQLASAAHRVTGHPHALLVAAGAVLVAVGVGWSLTPFTGPGGPRRRRGTPRGGAEASAAAHLRLLHYQLTYQHGRTAQLALPGGLQVSDAGQTQHTRQLLTYPELVGRFRELLDQVALERRALGGRVVIGIDELDKVGSAQEAERFLNDLKAVFGIRGCHFLVAVSEDALTAFGRHLLDVRTVFDSAFDRVVAVRPLDLAQARELLELRGVWLPDPFLWLCQILSGGLPRDLLRAVMSLATHRALDRLTGLPRLAERMIEDDARAVLSAQTRHAAGLEDATAPAVARWIADVAQGPAEADDWEAALGRVPAVPPEEYGTARVVAQVRAYLALGATLLRTFTGTAVTVARGRPDGAVNHLTGARAALATEPEASWAAVVRHRAGNPALPALPEP